MRTLLAYEPAIHVCELMYKTGILAFFRSVIRLRIKAWNCIQQLHTVESVEIFRFDYEYQAVRLLSFEFVLTTISSAIVVVNRTAHEPITIL